MSRRHNDIAERTVDDPSGTRVRRRHTGGKQRPHRRDRAWISRRRHLTRRCSTSSSRRASNHASARMRTASGHGDGRKRRRGGRPHPQCQTPRSHQPRLTSLVAGDDPPPDCSNGVCAPASAAPPALAHVERRYVTIRAGAVVTTEARRAKSTRRSPGPSLVWLRTLRPWRAREAGWCGRPVMGRSGRPRTAGAAPSPRGLPPSAGTYEVLRRLVYRHQRQAPRALLWEQICVRR